MKTLKKIKSLGVILLGIATLLVTSCSNNPKGLNTVPKDAIFVGVIDLHSIYKKGELEQIKNFEAFKTLQKELRSENKKLSDFVEEIMENPKKTGIDLKKDIFIYGIGDFKEGQAVCMSFELRDEQDFSQFIQKILSEANFNPEIKQIEKYSYIEHLGALITWDKNKALFVGKITGQNQSEQYIKKLMNLPSSEQITQNKSFNKFYKNKKDISFWLGMDIFQKQAGYLSFFRGLGYDFTDTYIGLFLSFEEKLISIKTLLQPGEEYAKRLKEYNIYGKSFNTNLLNYFPKQSYIAGSLALNPQGFHKYMKSLEGFQFIEEGINNEELGFSLQEVFDSFGGSFVFSLSGFEKIKYTYKNLWSEYDKDDENQEDDLIEYERLSPIMGFAFDLNGSKIVEKTLEKAEDRIEKVDDYYRFMFDGEYPAYFAFDDKSFFITNSESGIKNFKNGGFSSENLKSADIASKISKHSGYYYVNLNYDDYPESVKNELSTIQNENAFRVWTEILKEAEMTQIDENSGEFVIKFKKDGNSLSTILKAIDETSKKFLTF